MIQYFKERLAELEGALASVDENAFAELVKMCADTARSGRKIIVSGLGKNVPICEKFVGSLISLGIDAYFLHTNSAVHGDIGIVKDGDLAIILTKSGETAESIYLAEQLMKRNVSLWLLTFNRQSTLSDRINKRILLELESEGDLWNIMPNNSTTLNLMILQGVAMKTAEELGIGLDEFRRNHPGGAIGVMLENE